MNKKGVIVEEWKVRRKEWKKKEEKKKEKGKSGFGKSPFCFCLTVFASSLFPLALNHHATTHAHTHPPHTIQHDALVHTITCKQGRVLALLRTHGPFQQSCDDVIFFFAIRGFLLPNSFFYDQPKIFCNLQFEGKSLFCN